MDVAFALLLPLVGGYLFITGCTYLKYKVAREEGHKLYFRAAFHGVWLFFVAFLLLELLYALAGHWPWARAQREFAAGVLRPLVKEPQHAVAQFDFLLVCLLSVLCGITTPRLVNRFMTRTKEDAQWDAASENEFEGLLLKALIEAKTVSVTLSNQKVYVGTLLSTPEPRADRRFIALLPLMSGYRDEHGKVVFTTFYDEIYRLQPGSANDFRMALPVDKMMSLSLFDVALFAKFGQTAVQDAEAGSAPEARDE